MCMYVCEMGLGSMVCVGVCNDVCTAYTVGAEHDEVCSGGSKCVA